MQLLKKEDINSIGLAIFLCANPISWILPFNNAIVLICLFSLFILIINNKISTLINAKLFVIFLVMLMFLISYSISYHTEKLTLYFTSFLVFGLIGLFYSNVEINFGTFFKTILVISLISIPSILRIEHLSFENNMEATGFYMGVSYGSLRFLLGLLLLLSFFKNNLLRGGVILIILIYINFFMQYSNRGAILAVLLFTTFYYMINKDLLSVKNFIVFCLISFIISLYFIDILIVLNDFLNLIGLNIKAIDKVVMINSEQQDFSNGRAGLIELAFSDINNNLIFGNGIGVFDIKYGIYPHNFLIQILYEGGIIYLTPIFLVLFKFGKILLSNNYPKQYKIFLCYIFFAGIFELLFSNVYWRSVFFWFFVGLILNQKLKLKNIIYA